jgi:Fe2+ transport system protein FeoA
MLSEKSFHKDITDFTGDIHMNESTPLHLLRPGQRASITRVNGGSTLRRRFVEMGIIKGETILIERNAPLGDPVEYFIKGYHLALRKEEAAQIEVTLLGGENG